jgi:NAD(P)H-hydrate epimerase
MSLKILSAESVRSIDEYTIANEPISSINLMERAARSFSNAFIQSVGRTHEVTVLAGPGNNGGDALAVARILFKEGYKVKVYLVKKPENNLSKDCNENMWRWRNMAGVWFREIQQLDLAQLDFGDIVIDGLFGSGLNRPLDGIYEAVVKIINDSRSEVYSIDIPSGLYAEGNLDKESGVVVKAKHVFCFQFPKLAFLLPEYGEFVNHFKVLDIGLSDQAIMAAATEYFYLQKTDIQNILHARHTFSHKGTFGHALIIAGQYGQMGAAVMAAKACLRSGVGLLTMHCPTSGITILQASIPEAMVDPDEDKHQNSTLGDISPKQTVGIGPGLGKGKKQKRLLTHLLETMDRPMVIDADALNLIAENRELIELIPPGSILTPHPVEFDRLAGQVYKTGYNRLQAARKLAKDWHVVIVLKGAYTAISFPDGKTFFNSTGNPGMATAGSGDCLTGILTSLISQKYSPQEASIIGVFIHGLAGDLALEKASSMESLIASDIVEAIGAAFSKIRS